MADQIKNELVGEVVSPAEAEKKVTAPVNDESAFTESQADSEPSTDAAGGAAMKNSESEEGTKDNGSDELNEEKQPEKNYPVFKETPDGKRAPMLPRGDSIRKKRKPPVFANEVKLFEDDDDFDEEDGEFFPMTTASTAGAVVSGTDASDIKTSKGKKKRKNKKASTTDAAEIDSSDDISTVDTPILVADAGAQSAPASDVAEPMPISVVEPVAAPVVESPATSTVSARPVDPGIEEANILLADNRAAREERKRIKAARKAASAPEPDVAPVAVEVNNDVDTTDLAEDITPITVIDNGASVTPVAAPVAVKTKKEKPVDPGKAEAAALLADDKAERQRRKEMKALKAASKAAAPEADVAPVDVTNDDVAVVVPVAVDTTPTYSDVAPIPVAESATVAVPMATVKTKKEKPTDPGREEAAALLADDKAERQRIKELKRIKRENKYAPAGVVEPVVAPEAPVAVSAASTVDPTYYDDLIKNESALEPVAESNVSSYYDPMTDSIVRVIVQPAVSNAPVSDDPYSAAMQKKIDKKEEKAALLAIAAAEKQKAKEDKKATAPAEEDEREYDDAEAYVAPVVVPVKAQPKAQKEFSPASYDASQQKKADKKGTKSDKKAEREALALVYGEEKARAYAARNTEEPVAEEPMREYGDAEAYVAPVVVPVKAQPKAKKEFSPASYDASQQKKADKKDSKSDKKAEREALALVYGEEKARAYAARNSSTEAPVAEPMREYSDIDPYVVPVSAAAPKAAVPKAKKEFSASAYENEIQKNIDRKQAKSDKKAEQTALLAVAAAEKQKAKEDKARAKAMVNTEVAHAPEVVYGDAGAYTVPVKVAQAQTAAPKSKREFSTENFDSAMQKSYDKSVAKSDKKAEQAALLAVAAAEKQKAKEDKALEKALKSQPKETAPIPVYADTEAYVAPKQEAPAAKTEEPKPVKEISTKAYDKKTDRKHNKAATAAALVAFYNGNKNAPVVAKEEPTPAPVNETVYSDGNYDVGYDPDWRAKEKAAKAQEKNAAKEARRLERSDAKAASLEKRDTKYQSKYASHEEKLFTEAEQRDALLNTYKEEIAREKAAKAAARATAGVAVVKAVDEVASYDDFTETFDKAAYDAEKQAIADAEAKAKADAIQAKADKRFDKAAAKEAKIDAYYTKAVEKQVAKNDKKELKAEQKAALISTYKEDKAEAKELAAKEKEAKAAARAAAVVVPEEVVYDDFGETFDKEAYDRDRQAIIDAEAKAKADARQAKVDAREEKAAAKEAQVLASFEGALTAISAKIDKKNLKAEKKAELVSIRKQYNAEEKALEAEAKAKEEAAKAAAAAPVVKEEVLYTDFTETFDRAAYDAEKQAIADAKAQAKADAKIAKAAKHEESAARAEVKIAENYDKKTGERVAKLERETELLAANSAAKAEAKELATRAKLLAEAEKAANAKVVEDEVVYADFTETFDKAAYDAEKQAIADAEAKAKADAKIAKAAKHEASVARAEAKITEDYDKKTGERVAKLERETELLAANSAAKAEAKELAARAKLLAEAEKAANAKVVEDEVVYADFTETFDKAAYDAEKQAIADAEAKAKADAKIAKAAKHEASVARAEAKIAEDYDKKTGERIAKMEKEAELLAIDKSARAEAKELSAREKAVRKAEKLIASSKRPEEIVYPDPEYVPDEFSGDLLDISLPEPGDVLEGGVPRITSVRELRRARKEDQELRLLVKKSKKHLKKAAFDIETIELAEKYVDDGALEMADTKTVVKDAKLFKREEKDLAAVKELEGSLENKEMLYFEQDYKNKQRTNKRRLNKAKKYGKFMLEYGSTYDPEWDGDFNNYGLPEIHPFTQGVKLPGSRRRTPKKEKLSYFNQKNLNELSREQCKTDIQMIESRVEFDYTALDIEVATVEQEFSGEYRSKKEKRWLRDSREKLKNFKAKLASAVKFEKLDNERYYSVVATDFARVELPAKADRDELIAMREELMRLLDIRDDINAELLELYSGKENGMKGSTKGRAKATLKARKRAHRRLMRYYNAICKHRVTRNEKMRIFDKMDEIVELKGDIARANYILRKEKPTGKVKRDYIRERKLAKRDVRILKKSVERSTIKALKRARKLERQRRVMFISYAIVGAVLLFVLAMMVMGPQILEASKTFLPENLHEYIDLILNEWPKK